MKSPSDPKHEQPDKEEVQPIQWPPETYRDWVESQIANKLFLKLSAVGVGSLILIIAGYFTIQEVILERAQGDVSKAVVEEVKPLIRTEVLSHLVNEAELIEETKKKISSDVNAAVELAIEDKINDESFSNEAAKNLLAKLHETRGLQVLLLKEALNSAENADASDSTRATGLQLYSLLHAGARTSDGVAPMRSKFVEIIEQQLPEIHATPKLLTAILENYPFGEYDIENSMSECYPRLRQCKDWDDRMTKAILKLLGDQKKYLVNQSLFESFFRRTPPESASYLLHWVRENSKLPLAKDVLLAMLKSNNNEIMYSVIHDLGKLTTLSHAPHLRQIGLEALATMDVHIPMSRATRQVVLKMLWEAATEKELIEAFPRKALEELIELTRVHHREKTRSEKLAEWRDTYFFTAETPRESTSYFLRRAIVSLIRTGLHVRDEVGQSVNDPSAANDWELVLAPTVSFGTGESYARALVAWTLRMGIDDAASRDTQWAAEKMLMTSPTRMKKSAIVPLVMEYAVSRSTPHGFELAANQYLTDWLVDSAPINLIDLTSAFVKRDGISDEPYAWLTQVFGEQSNEHLFDHFLDAIHGKHFGVDHRGRVERFRWVVSQIKTGDFADVASRQMSKVLAKELVRRTTKLREFWEIAHAIEEEGVFVAQENVNAFNAAPEIAAAMETLRARMPWIGRPVLDGTIEISVPGRHDLVVKLDSSHKQDGGSWYRLSVDRTMEFRVEGLSPDLEMVVMDEDRDTSFRRIRNVSGSEYSLAKLDPGSYSVSFRTTETDSIPGVRKVSFESKIGTQNLGIGSRNQPVQVSTSSKFHFNSDEKSGELWFIVSLGVNTYLEIETRSVGSRHLPAISPYLLLIFFDEVSPEFYDELMERMRYVEPDAYDDWQEIRRRNRRAFREFELVLREFSPDYIFLGREMRHLPMALDLMGRILSDLPPGALIHFRNLLSSRDNRRERLMERILMEMVPELHFVMGDLMQREGVDTHIALLDRETGAERVKDDDGGQGANAKIVYESEGAEEMLVRISRCCVEPFMPNDQFLVDMIVRNRSNPVHETSENAGELEN